MTRKSICRNWFFGLVFISVIRMILAIWMPPTQDETYYFYWSRFLDWGYFDHPPLVAWISSPTNMWPKNPFAARVGTLLLSTLSIPLLWNLYRTLGVQNNTKRVIALFLVSGSVAGLSLGYITTPDIPLIFCWIAALHEAAIALESKPMRWLSAGFFTGLGILGKYTMVLIGPVFLLALLAEPRQLKRVWPYLGGLVCILTIVPHLLWLQDHEWITLRFQFDRGLKSEYDITMQSGSSLPLAHDSTKDSQAKRLADFFKLREDEMPKPKKPAPSGLQKRLQGFADFIGSQLSLLGALLAPLIFALIRKRESQSTWNSRSLGTLCWAACLVPLLCFGLLSPFQHVEANWAAMYLIGAAPLLSQGLGLTIGMLAPAILINALLCVVVVIHCHIPLQTRHAHRDRTLRETHGYKLLAEYLAQQKQPVFVDTYQNLSQLAFYQPQLSLQQWPGIARTSELLRRAEMNPISWSSLQAHNGFYLLMDNLVPPAIPGTEIEVLTEILDCVDGGLQLTLSRSSPSYIRPCDQRVHRWSLAYYRTMATTK